MAKNEANEQYSVFDDPIEHTPPKKSGSKMTVLIICIVVAVCIGAAAVAAGKLMPEESSSSSENPLFESVKLVDISSDTLASVKVTNHNGTFEFTPSQEQVEATDTSSAYTVTNWYVNGADKEKTNTASTESVVSAAAIITAMREITEKTASDCGLEAPVCEVEVITQDSKTYTLLIGDSSPDGYGVYIKLKDSEKAYIADSSVLSSFDFALSDLVSE